MKFPDYSAGWRCAARALRDGYSNEFTVDATSASSDDFYSGWNARMAWSRRVCALVGAMLFISSAVAMLAILWLGWSILGTFDIP